MKEPPSGGFFVGGVFPAGEAVCIDAAFGGQGVASTALR